MKLNKKREAVHTHEGGIAKHINAALALRRAVMCCMLWEDTFYEDGVEIAKRIADLVPQVDPDTVAAMAIEAREDMKLRHVPLYLVRLMAALPNYKPLVASTLARVIQRPDELAEFVALYWKDGKQPLSAQVKKGLAEAFTKFDAYQLSKWNKDTEIKLRDVLFLCHAKPKDKAQDALWKQLIDGTLEPPDTWEVGLSTAKEKGLEKADVWTRLLEENKMGALALLRNLRNFKEHGVEDKLVKRALEACNPRMVLPFRFITAARHAPHVESELEQLMLKCLSTFEKIPGHTALLVDVSGSMDERIGIRDCDRHRYRRVSPPVRLDMACGLAILLRELCEKIDIFTFSLDFVQIPSRHGFSLRDAIVHSQDHNATYLGLAVKSIYESGTHRIKGRHHGHITFKGVGLDPDRLIVLTDEQSHDPVPNPQSKGFMCNVAPYKYGVGYGPWVNISGWSESIVRWITEYENEFMK